MPRLQILGLDKPFAEPLRLAKDPLPVLLKQATTHELHRLDCVAEMLALVGVMTAKSALTGREVVTVGGAIFQFGTGVRSDRTQAAHCLPGQLEFNGRPIHTMSDWNPASLETRGIKPLALSSKLRNLSGRTDAADEVVNQVDSLMEIMPSGRGLKPALGRSTGRLMDNMLKQKPQSWWAVGKLVQDALDHYRFTASLGYKERLDFLDQAAQRNSSTLELENNRRKKLVAEEYLRVAQDSSVVPEAANPTAFDRLVKEVIQGVGDRF